MQQDPVVPSGPARLGGSLHRLIESAERSGPLRQAAGRVLAGVAPALERRRLRELLHGTWLGHSAHPFFTDFPEGAWMAASFLDLFGPEGSEAPAQRLLGFGLVAAVPAALTGMADWSKSEGAGRQSGLVHAVTSSVATLLYAASYAARRGQQQGPAVALGVAGGLVATLDGWVGGHLSLGRGLGVANHAFDEPPAGWTVTSIDPELLKDGGPLSGTAGGMQIVAVSTGNKLFALPGRCSFDGALLAEGTVWEDAIVCPRHGCAFGLEDGEVRAGPASVPLNALQARIEAGRVEVRAA